MQRARAFEVGPRLYNDKTRRLEYPFFEGTSQKFLDTMATMLERETFEKQDYIFKEGEVGFNMYFISSGSVILANSVSLGEVHILSRGQHCGELAVFGVSRRSTSAIAREHTECLVLKNRVFRAVLERFPEEKGLFMRLAARRKAQRFSKSRREEVFRVARRADSDSDRDADDDPAPKQSSDTEAPLPDSEIPGAYPQTKKMTILEIRAPPRHGPQQLAPLDVRIGKELASVGRSAFMRKMAVAEAVSRDMAPISSSSVRPSSARSKKELKSLEPEDKTAKELKEDLFDLNFDKMDLNAVDPWRRAVSA